LPVPGEVVERPKLIDVHLPKIEEWVERSKGKIRADVVFERLEAVGFEGSARTVRRAVARLLIAHPPSSNRVRIRPALRRVPAQASETVPRAQLDSDSQAENASSTLVTRSIK